MLGGGLVRLPRLVVAAPGEPLLALAARPWSGPGRAAARPWTRRSRSPASRATAKPPLRTSSTPQSSGGAELRREGRRRPARRRTSLERAAGRGTSSRRPPPRSGRRRRPPARAAVPLAEVGHPALHPLAGNEDVGHGPDANGTGLAGRTSDGACVSAPLRSSAWSRSPARSPAAASMKTLLEDQPRQSARRTASPSSGLLPVPASPPTMTVTGAEGPVTACRPPRLPEHQRRRDAAPMPPRWTSASCALTGAGPARFAFPVEGWSFTATFNEASRPAAGRRQHCRRRADRAWALTLTPPSGLGDFRVDLTGTGPQGDYAGRSARCPGVTIRR